MNRAMADPIKLAAKSSKLTVRPGVPFCSSSFIMPIIPLTAQIPASQSPDRLFKTDQDAKVKYSKTAKMAYSMKCSAQSEWRPKNSLDFSLNGIK